MDRRMAVSSSFWRGCFPAGDVEGVVAYFPSKNRLGFLTIIWLMTSSDTPSSLLSHMQLDIGDPNFWSGGLVLLEDLVEEAEALAGAL